jgi:glycosyltransferase involved in cell wall biosynthesis
VSRPALGLSIPLYNEEAVAGDFAADLRNSLRAAKIPTAIVLVNNGSTDGTGKIINQLAAKDDSFLSLHLSENLGYGGGILAGMRQLQTPILGWAWGDGQVAASVVVEAYTRMVQSGAPLAKANRTQRQDGTQRKLVSRAYNLAMGAMGSPVRDTNGCPKLFTRAAWEAIAPRSNDWFLDPEVVLRAQELGFEWQEVEGIMQARAGGASKVHRDTVLEFIRHLRDWRRGWRP